MNIPVQPVSCCFRDKAAFDHGPGICQVKLEHMSPGLQVDPQRKGILVIIRSLSREQVIMFRIHGYAATQFEPCTRSDGKNIVLVDTTGYQVFVDVCGTYLKAEAGSEFPGGKKLGNITEPVGERILIFGSRILEGIQK